MKFRKEANRVTFYEKRGCVGNRKQKNILKQSGIPFETKSILDTKWTPQSLKPFFNGVNIEDMVNQSAPQIKRKELDLSIISKDELIDLMCKVPILIKRPLLEIDEAKICGFDIDKINYHLKTNIEASEILCTKI
jgi:nitrogenase-associated protein